MPRRRDSRGPSEEGWHDAPDARVGRPAADGCPQPGLPAARKGVRLGPGRRCPSSPPLAIDACAAALAPAAGESDRDRAIARAQQDAGKAARARGALERLGYLYIARARVSNDPGDYKLAEKAAGCLESRYPGEAAALLLRGHVLHQLHRFREAEQMARRWSPGATVVLDYGLLGDALMEQGRLRSRRGLPEDDRSQALLSVLHTRRAPALAERRSSRSDRAACGWRSGRPAHAIRSRRRGPGRASQRTSCRRVVSARPRRPPRPPCAPAGIRGRPSGARPNTARNEAAVRGDGGAPSRRTTQPASRVSVGARRRPARAGAC